MTSWMAFVPVAAAVVIVPGPSVLYLTARSAAHGRVAGLFSMLGLEAGATVHLMATAFGVATLLASIPTAMAALRYAGAAYLIWLAWRQLRAACPAVAADQTPDARVSPLRLLRDGLLVDLLNPKTALFFLAVLPRFVVPARGNTVGQLLALGGAFLAVAVLCDGGYALIAGAAVRRLQRSATARIWIGRISGGIYLVLAGAAIFSG